MSLGDGVIAEFGVFSANTIKRIASTYKDRTIYGFDSFEGLPESWDRPDMKFDKGAFNLNTVLPSVPSNVVLKPGWFDDTIPSFVEDVMKKEDRLALLHIDCDIYSSTKCIFDNLAPYIKSGTIIVFDELLNYPTYEKHEILAFYEAMQQNPEWKVQWIGKRGKVIVNPTRDYGTYDQPVALQIV